MKQEYDFSKAKKSPYAKKLKKQITVDVSINAIAYFKKLSKETGIPYKSLIDMYLNQCAFEEKKPEIVWK